jgi:S-methylmethionine-dependent homocysteine/selenocysteine methylase
MISYFFSNNQNFKSEMEDKSTFRVLDGGMATELIRMGYDYIDVSKGLLVLGNAQVNIAEKLV